MGLRAARDATREEARVMRGDRSGARRAQRARRSVSIRRCRRLFDQHAVHNQSSGTQSGESELFQFLRIKISSNSTKSRKSGTV